MFSQPPNKAINFSPSDLELRRGAAPSRYCGR